MLKKTVLPAAPVGVGMLLAAIGSDVCSVVGRVVVRVESAWLLLEGEEVVEERVVEELELEDREVEVELELELELDLVVTAAAFTPLTLYGRGRQVSSNHENTQAAHIRGLDSIQTAARVGQRGSDCPCQAERFALAILEKAEHLKLGSLLDLQCEVVFRGIWSIDTLDNLQRRVACSLGKLDSARACGVGDGCRGQEEDGKRTRVARVEEEDVGVLCGCIQYAEYRWAKSREIATQAQ